jgi:hypothetical protein
MSSIPDSNNAIEMTDEAVVVSPLRKVFSFVKKHWLAISVTTALALLSSLLFLFIPVINVNSTKLVNLDTSVRIEWGQIAKLKLGDVSVKVVHFTNEACPKGVVCFASAKGVEYVLTVNGQNYATGSLNPENKSGYNIITESSDYKTYSVIKIVKSE